MISWNSFSYAFGPLVALLAMGLLVLLLRWAFRRDPDRLVRAVHPGRADQYGALVAVATPPDETAGRRCKDRLRAEGIRATYAVTLDGPRVLVFPTDAARARAILRTPPA